MRKLASLCILLWACGGETSISVLDSSGKVMDVIQTSPEQAEKMRGDLVLRTQMLSGGSGYVVDCGTARNPYLGESTVYDQNWGGGQCSAIGTDWSPGFLYFDLNEPVASFGNGATMNNALRSAQSRATAQAQMRVSWNRSFGGSGGGLNDVVPAGQTHVFNVFKSEAVCPLPSWCTGPPEDTSFFGTLHN